MCAVICLSHHTFSVPAVFRDLRLHTRTAHSLYCVVHTSFITTLIHNDLMIFKSIQNELSEINLHPITTMYNYTEYFCGL